MLQISLNTQIPNVMWVAVAVIVQENPHIIAIKLTCL